MIKYKVSILLFFGMLFSSCDSSQRDLNTKELRGGLELLTSEQTGINFNNAIQETKSFNHFYFSQIYSGAGVAIGDINNDGLADVFFCGNQVNDRLYLNKGDFQFEDISKQSKISRSPGWSWGVTMADVNADGYLDIYVSRNGESIDPIDRKNKLFINNKDLTFTESARLYGLDDAGFSTQAVFFDMDKDGDLDMYQVNQPADSKLFLRHNITSKNYKYFTDKFYRNDNGKYKDISEKVGISNSFTSYGLSVSAVDFNSDNWMDLYVANDYGEPDFLYQNNGNGTFTNVINEKMNHISHLSMGSDSGDINNDGLFDFLTIDMSSEDHYRSKTNMQSMNVDLFNSMVNNGKHHQYMINTLQINRGEDGFSDIANLAGVSRTDWSWSGLFIDLDNDSWKDIIISNGIKKDVLNNDYRNYINNLSESITADEFFNVSKKAPSMSLSNYAYQNTHNLKFKNVSEKWSFDLPSFSSGMAYGDLDNDGDLDIVTNNMESNAFVYKNNANGNFFKIKFKGSAKNNFAYGAKAIIFHNGKKQISQNTVTRGYLSSVEPGLFFGLGMDTKIDSIQITWSDDKISIYHNLKANTILTANHKDAQNVNNIKEDSSKKIFTKVVDTKVDFIHKENEYNEYEKEVLLPHNISQNGPYTSIADVNNDGLEDLFIGGATGQSGVLYLQKENGKFFKNLSQPWEKDLQSEDLGSLFFDADGDKDMDLYITSGGSEKEQGNKALNDRLYINNGEGKFERKKNQLPNIYLSTQCVKSSDIDNDGDLDLFVGTRIIPNKYGFPPTSYLLINEKGIFKKASINMAQPLEKLGMVTDAVFSDIDNDTYDDLIVVGEWMKIVILKNVGGQKFIDKSKEYNLEGTTGLWWSITANDIDDDGDEDYIIGNLGSNNKFKASKEHPFKIYANDFDNNGTNDVVLAKYYKDGYVPMRGKECSTQQMPFLAKKFNDYHSFASSKLLDVLPKKKIKDAIIHEVSSFESVIIINKNGKLLLTPLPNMAQISPIKSSIVDDFNNDGLKDILFVGNHFGVEVETTRYDAGFGGLLLGDGENNFNFIDITKSGFSIKNDSRSLKMIRTIGDEKNIIVSSNNSPLTFLKY